MGASEAGVVSRHCFLANPCCLVVTDWSRAQRRACVMVSSPAVAIGLVGNCFFTLGPCQAERLKMHVTEGSAIFATCWKRISDRFLCAKGGQTFCLKL